MAQRVREVMTSDPRTVDAGAPVVEAARVMADADVGPSSWSTVARSLAS
jgi:hypothetical protein